MRIIFGRRCRMVMSDLGGIRGTWRWMASLAAACYTGYHGEMTRRTF